MHWLLRPWTTFQHCLLLNYGKERLLQLLPDCLWSLTLIQKDLFRDYSSAQKLSSTMCCFAFVWSANWTPPIVGWSWLLPTTWIFFLVSATKVPSLPQETSQFSEHRLNMALGIQSAEGATFQDVDDPVAHPFSPLSEYLKPRFSGSTPWRSFFFFSFVLLHHACPLPSPMFLREAASNLLILSYICSTDFLCRPWREDFSHWR